MTSPYRQFENPTKSLEVGDLCLWDARDGRFAQWLYLVTDINQQKQAIVIRLPDMRIFDKVPWFMLIPLTPPTS